VSVAEKIDEAVAREKARIKADEERGRTQPQPHPMPTRAEAWKAYLASCEDDERPPDADEFERWWSGA
jgi:hypothetical protein